MRRRMYLWMLLLPVLGYSGQVAGQALAVGTDQGLLTLLGQAIGNQEGMSWPIAVVIVTVLIVRESRRAAIATAKELREWKPPTIRIRLEQGRGPDTGEHVVRDVDADPTQG